MIIYRPLIGAGPWCSIDRSPSYQAERRGGKGGIGGEVAYNSIKRTVALHDLEELDNDLGAGSDQDLALAGLLGIVDAVKSVVENGSADHFGGIEWRFSSRDGGNEVSTNGQMHVRLGVALMNMESALSDSVDEGSACSLPEGKQRIKRRQPSR